jgi:hypothetical protein
VATAGAIAGYVAGVFSIGLELVAVVRDDFPQLTFLAVLAGGALGATQPTSESLLVRIERTHRELPDAITGPSALLSAAVGLAAFVVAAVLAHGDGPTLAVLRGLQLVLAFVAVVSTSAASSMLAGLVRARRKPRRSNDETTGTESSYFDDAPIASRGNDRLDRQAAVDSLVDAIVGLRAASPGYVALEGRYGAGKSSVIAISREALTERGLISAAYSAFHSISVSIASDGLVSAVERSLNERYATVALGQSFRTYYESLRPVVGTSLPIALPSLPRPDSPRRRLEKRLRNVPSPIAVFVEDLDRLEGGEILALLGSVQVIFGGLNQFVVVFAYDGDVLARQLERLVADAGEHIVKAANVRVVVAPPKEAALATLLAEMVDGVVAARGAAFTDRPGQAVPFRAAVRLLETVRNAKAAANTFSVALLELDREVDAFDLLLGVVLERMVPTLLDAIDDNRAAWLEGLGFEEGMRAAFDPDRVGQDVREVRRDAIRKLVETESARRATGEITEWLFPDNADPADLRRGQRLGHLEYFTRFRHRTLDPGAIRDRGVTAVIEAVNGAKIAEVPEAFAQGLATATDQLGLLSKLTLRVQEIRTDARLPTAIGIAQKSRDLPFGASSWEPAIGDEAARLIAELIVTTRSDDRPWHADAIPKVFAACASLFFARRLAPILAARDHGAGPVPDEDPYSAENLRISLATAVRTAISAGSDPFQTEPGYAPYIVAAIADPMAAAEFAADRHRVSEVVAAYQDPSTHAVDWDKLAAAYDLDRLAAGIDAAGALDRWEIDLLDHLDFVIDGGQLRKQT